MKLFLKILFFVFTMITTVGESHSSTVVNNFQKETSYSIYQEAQNCDIISAKEAAGLAEPIGLNDWIDFHGADYYNMYRLAAGTSLAFQFVGAPSGQSMSRANGYNLKMAGSSVANGGMTAVENITVHGNSLKSMRPTWGYKLYSNDGTFLKNGITSRPIPETRYTRSFMGNKHMKVEPLFPNRRAAWNWEYQQNLIQKGPLNKNLH